MNKKPLYQPWSEEEFQSDIHVRAMNPYERWIYASLLRSAFICSTRPYLPNDPKILWILGGCPDSGFWLTHKDKVLERFSLVNIDGIELLENKRVSEDWEKLQEYRSRMTEWGRKSNENRKLKRLHMPVDVTTHASEADYEQDKIREVNISEEKESEEMRRRTFEAICHKHGLAPDPRGYSGWSDLAGMCEGIGDRIVEAAFEEWASSQLSPVINPVSKFVKVAPIWTKKISGVEENPRLEEFCDWVADKSDMHIIFNKIQKAEVSELLDKYQYPELALAFEKFYAIIENDLYQLKFGARDFVEKAPQILRTIQKRKAEAEAAAKEIAEIKSRVTNEGAAMASESLLDEPSEEDVLRELGFNKEA